MTTPATHTIQRCQQCLACHSFFLDGRWFCGLDPESRDLDRLHTPPPDWCPLRAAPVLVRLETTP